MLFHLLKGDVTLQQVSEKKKRSHLLDVFCKRTQACFLLNQLVILVFLSKDQFFRPLFPSVSLSMLK